MEKLEQQLLFHNKVHRFSILIIIKIIIKKIKASNKTIIPQI